jgi:hypothetical protein
VALGALSAALPFAAPRQRFCEKKHRGNGANYPEHGLGHPRRLLAADILTDKTRSEQKKNKQYNFHNSVGTRPAAIVMDNLKRELT